MQRLSGSCERDATISETPPIAKRTNYRLTQAHAHNSIETAHRRPSAVTSLTLQCLLASEERPVRWEPSRLPCFVRAFEADVEHQEARLRRLPAQWTGSSARRASKCHCFSYGAFFRCVSAAIDGQWRVRRIGIGAARGGGTRSRNLRAFSQYVLYVRMFVLRIRAIFKIVTEGYHLSSYDWETHFLKNRV